MSIPLNILILEDNHDDAELLTIELEMSGFDVHWTRVDSEMAFRKALSASFDVILADYTLPQFNAPSALRVLQERGLDIPFIVVTGSISEEVAVTCLRQGAWDYLIKDRLSRLGESIRQALTQKQLKQEKQEANRNLRVMEWAIDSSINATAMADLDGRITYVNPAFLKLWGLPSSKEIIGTSLLRMWAYDPAESLVVQHALKSKVDSQGEMVASHIEGTPMILQYTASPVLDEDRTPICIMAMFIDITAQKQAQDTRREADILRIQLENEMELRRIKSRFTSMVIHDFRNPLTTIKLQLSLLRDYHTRLSPEKQAEKLSIVLEQVNSLNALMEDVLTLSRIEGGSGFNPVEQDLETFIQAIINDFDNTLNGSHQLILDCQLHGISAWVDVGLLRRALLNLLSNASKYSAEGTEIGFSVSATEDKIRIVIQDQGIGIPEEDQERLFEAFHRAHNVGLIEGTGLGMVIVKHVVDLHEGTIDCDSIINQGTTFTITLPRYVLR